MVMVVKSWKGQAARASTCKPEPIVLSSILLRYLPQFPVPVDPCWMITSAIYRAGEDISILIHGYLGILDFQASGC